MKNLTPMSSKHGRSPEQTQSVAAGSADRPALSAAAASHSSARRLSNKARSLVLSLSSMACSVHSPSRAPSPCKLTPCQFLKDHPSAHSMHVVRNLLHQGPGLVAAVSSATAAANASSRRRCLCRSAGCSARRDLLAAPLGSIRNHPRSRRRRTSRHLLPMHTRPTAAADAHPSLALARTRAARARVGALACNCRTRPEPPFARG
mmetsp:Transcript_10513/g.43437  ORF Transcript_10513/g.43437 Transcript_10513/m.43437 type:complete len:205 (-) Transcript_10513:160-774(-)